jgi:serine protease Do
VLQVYRRGGYRDLGVTVGEFDADRPARPVAAPSAPPSIVRSMLGLGITDLSEAQRHELKVRGGVLVESVEGPALRAGVREGDVILSLENTEITDAKHFSTLVGKLEKTRAVSVLVRRGEWVNYLVLRPGR